MTLSQAIQSLVEQSKRDQAVADDLFASGKYMYCLFFHHLALEKALKALVLHKGKELVYTHKLVALAKIGDLPLTDEQIRDLSRITDFNIEARYDDYKSEFYKTATQDFTKEWAHKSSELYTYIITCI
jgi:HEPN domain-containing protein